LGACQIDALFGPEQLAFFDIFGVYRFMATVAKTPRKKKAATEVDQTGAPEAAETPVAKPKRTRKAAVEPRIRLYWGVFNQNLKRVAVFDYDDLKKAEKHCKELSKTAGDHFLQKIKETVTE
jgi:hypothetical protein